MTAGDRRFLFLQGPHGPWFHRLGRMLQAAGGQVWRIGFNLGDRVFWPGPGYIAFTGAPQDWAGALADHLDRLAITDIVLYGDTRPIHATAVQLARARGLTVHVFEEGYLRPYWVTYERGGANGNSRLMGLSVDQMQRALDPVDIDLPDSPGTWGDMRQHMFWGALYHGCVALGARAYRRFRPHRDLTVGQEFLLYLKSFLLMPLHRAQRRLATFRIRFGGFPYHLAILQLDHDASFRDHSPFRSTGEFLGVVMAGFAKGAPRHHHLVFKAHPLEDGRTPLAADIARLAHDHGLAGRVHFVRGGKLAHLLTHASTAVTVNSTAGQQALWRGIPLRTFGTAVYAKPEFVSSQPLDAFFAAPDRPDTRAYRAYRRFLLETSQVSGGFYSSRGRRALLRQVVDMMLSSQDPYAALSPETAAPRQQLRVVK
ncbi:capsule biosynthesis protein [Tabrizicola sp. BL-A-41-H6]|uniref:capsule biosynthesis protein n=1 Tax=Tabrizicola sp. BL-A-41-H6 TaxID=3421107 RepID=UPI003D6652D2